MLTELVLDDLAAVASGLKEPMLREAKLRSRRPIRSREEGLGAVTVAYRRFEDRCVNGERNTLITEATRLAAVAMLVVVSHTQGALE